MDAAYNLFKLFKDDEFDVLKGYNSCSGKEAYFLVLQRFTVDSGMILERYHQMMNSGKKIDMRTLIQCSEKLQEILVSIGAINLAWKVQSQSRLISETHYDEYLWRLREILTAVDSLRKRIINAEKKENNTPETAVHLNEIQRYGTTVPGTVKVQAKPRYSSFKELSMLIDNIEYDSAKETIYSLMMFSYTPEIDQSLKNICKNLDSYNFAKSSEEAQKLLDIVVNTRQVGINPRKNILAIDDIPDVLRTLKVMLMDKYNVYGMTTYDLAIKFLRKHTVDLILLDIEMPGLDGFAMMQLFRKIPEYAKTPIMFLTGNASQEHVKTVMSLGALDCIKKPVDLTVLIEKLEKAFS